MATKIGSLIAEFAINTARFDAGIKSAGTKMQKFTRKAKRQFRSVRRSINKMSGSLKAYGLALVAIAGPAAIGALTKSSLEAVDAQAKLADTLGISTTELAGFELAGQRTGATVEQVKKSLEKLAVNTSDAANGIGLAKDAFKRLNLDAKETIKLPMAEQFKLVGDRLRTVENATERVGLAYKIFGRQGTNMIKMLQLSREELDGFEKRAIALGSAVSRFDAAKIEQANDAMLEVGQAVKGVGNSFAIQLAPMIQGFSEMIADSSVAANGWRDNIKLAIISVIRSIGLAADAWHGFKLVVKALPVFWAKAFNIIHKGMITFGAAIDAITTGIGHGFTAMINAIKIKFGEFLESVSNNKLAKTFLPGMTAEVRKLALDMQSAGKGAETLAEKLAKIAVDKNIAIAATDAGFQAVLKKFQEELAGELPSEAFDKLIEKMREKSAEMAGAATGEVTKALGAISEESEKTNTKLAGVFEGFFGGFKSGMDNMVSMWINNLKKMVAEAAASNLLSAFGGSSGGAAGGIASVAKKLFGFANGGQFDVGGRGGTDSNVVAFRATKGERVTIQTPQQQRSGGSVNLVINNTFNGGGNESQMRAELDRRDMKIKADIANAMRRKRF